MDLNAKATENAMLTVNGKELSVVHIEYCGYMQRTASMAVSVGQQGGAYRAAVWYSPKLGRVVRFEARTRGGSGGGAFQIDEQLDLVRIY